MVWPPIWQDGNALSLDEVYNNRIMSKPVMKDPKTGKAIDNTKAWVTDQAYTGGHGANFTGIGVHTNKDTCSLGSSGYEWQCAKKKHPGQHLAWHLALVEVAASMAATLSAVLPTTTPGPTDPNAARCTTGAPGPSAAVPWR